MKTFGKILFTIAFILFSCFLYSQKSLITHIYAADPSAKVWQNDPETLWLYTSHDIPGTNHHATMHGYHVFSTKDLVNWIDHGRVLSVDDVDWAISHAWAIDAVYRHGQYYLVYCMIEQKTGMFRTGLATSEVPQGPFSDIGFIEGVEWGQDPCLYIDDDKYSTPYLFWGSGGRCHVVQLTDDLMQAVPGTQKELTNELKEVFEGPWVHKYKGKYYLSYPALPGGEWPETMYYAVADNPMGPYEYKGEYIPYFEGQSGTNHGSIVKFNDDWIAFYHSALVSGGMSEVRNLMADFLFYNADGTIQTILPTNESVLNGKKPMVKIHLEAEDAKQAGGRLFGTQIESTERGFSGKGYVSGFDVKHDYVEVLVQVAKDIEGELILNLKSDTDCKLDVLIGAKMLDGWLGTKVEKTNGWQRISLGQVGFVAGNNIIRINCKNREANLKIDFFLVDLK